MEELPQGRKIIGFQNVQQPESNLERAPFFAQIAAKECAVQAGLNFMIGITKCVNPLPPDGLFNLFDGQIAGLKQQGFRRDVTHIKRGKQSHAAA